MNNKAAKAMLFVSQKGREKITFSLLQIEIGALQTAKRTRNCLAVHRYLLLLLLLLLSCANTTKRTLYQRCKGGA